jgi:hypothetical protein
MLNEPSPRPHAEKTNTGVAPLLYGAARGRATPRLAIEAEADAAAAPQGRAIDASLKCIWSVSPRTELQLGLRVLDGGADNDEVVSFATFYYAVAGVAFPRPDARYGGAATQRLLDLRWRLAV